MTLQREQDRATVRELAERVMEFATSEEYERRRQRWRDVNGLRQPDRAPVWCRPWGAWQEIVPDDSLECQDSLCRRVEYTLRQDLFKADVGDDHIIEPYWPVPAAFDCDSEFTWGLETHKLVDSTEDGGWRWEHPIQTEEDFDKITVPTFTYNPRRTDEALNEMGDLLGDAMPVKLVCSPPLDGNLSPTLESLRRMDQLMMDMVEQPHLIHRLMAKLCEGALCAMRTAEETGLLTPNNNTPMFCSDPVGEPDPSGKIFLRNLWGGTNSQEFQSISPAMTQEFLFNYLLPIYQQYGLTHFGCCEDLTHKIENVLRLPNLRIFVCSAWTDLDKVIEACGRDYCIMWRQPAAEVTLTDDIELIRQHLENGMRRLQGHYYQIVLREIETLHGHPRRLHEWTQIGMEIAEKYA